MDQAHTSALLLALYTTIRTADGYLHAPEGDVPSADNTDRARNLLGCAMEEIERNFVCGVDEMHETLTLAIRPLTSLWESQGGSDGE